MPISAFSSSHLFESRQYLPSHNAISNLTDEEVDQFTLGRSFFTVPWVAAPSATTARDGLGPLFNANACVACHSETQHKTPFKANENVHQTLVFKLSQPQKHHLRPAHLVTMPDPVYDKLQLMQLALYLLKLKQMLNRYFILKCLLMVQKLNYAIQLVI
ncbi:hypothetical protein CEP49_03965 [Mergibacter septicus]|uniref:di-heme oxidoredictase family protein n=1 Tax=Mergibacter septicus TaxID=221402 RepID=UPI001179601A|nr:di-heme oxidoredictase family protein [Mergibacter septicus]AWX13767.1 hypothetical protein CEP49_03965 [Mergibacter septicus]